jgi:formylglycine-generating enzyme required for sulfatase activity
VEFLNQNLGRISVKDGVVRSNGDIWLLLGPMREGYDPIRFESGAFHVKEPGLASYPVLRVTPRGADAYARFFGRRLPTDAEWRRALQNEVGAEEPGSKRGSDVALTAPGQSHMDAMLGQVRPRPRGPAPVLDVPANSRGVRGPAGNFQEWSIRAPAQGADAVEYVAMPSAVARHPWEAFDDVGFRCALTK